MKKVYLLLVAILVTIMLIGCEKQTAVKSVSTQNIDQTLARNEAIQAKLDTLCRTIYRGMAEIHFSAGLLCYALSNDTEASSEFAFALELDTVRINVLVDSFSVIYDTERLRHDFCTAYLFAAQMIIIRSELDSVVVRAKIDNALHLLNRAERFADNDQSHVMMAGKLRQRAFALNHPRAT